MKKLGPKLQPWIDARRRHHLSHAQVQMARELGLNPVKLGKLDNHKQEPWKLPLPQFIEELYRKRFGRAAPAVVISVEERHRRERQEKEARRAAKQQRTTLSTHCSPAPDTGSFTHNLTPEKPK
jgi:hypothetical protein